MKSFDYYLFYKPYGVLCQFTSGPGERDLSEFGLPKHIYAAGRLDKDSEGLLLLTNDGTLINQLLSPNKKQYKCYLVQVEGIPTHNDLSRLAKGVQIKDYTSLPCEVYLLDTEPELPKRDPPIRYRKNIPTRWLEIKICEGKNRQVRRMTASIGHPTLRLVRTQIGPFALNNLRLGEFTRVPPTTIKDFYVKGLLGK